MQLILQRRRHLHHPHPAPHFLAQLSKLPWGNTARRDEVRPVEVGQRPRLRLVRFEREGEHLQHPRALPGRLEGRRVKAEGWNEVTLLLA